jgi:HEAT repeat protein
VAYPKDLSYESASRVVLVGTTNCPNDADNLPPLPQVRKNIHDLARIFRDPKTVGLPTESIVKILNVDEASAIGGAIARAAAAANDTLIVYYAGHGLYGDQYCPLYLASKNTISVSKWITGVRITDVKNAIRESPARKRILILDCCYAGRAFLGMGTPIDEVNSAIDIEGTYGIAAVPGDFKALALPGERLTKFTQILINILKQGIPGPKRTLTMDDIYKELRAQVGRETGLPPPQRTNWNEGGLFRLARNRWSARPGRGIMRVLKCEDRTIARISLLLEIMERPFHDERLHAIQQLGTIGPAAKLALPTLIRAAKENNPEIKKASFEALGNIGPAAVEAVAILVAALNEPDQDVRSCAADALGRIGPVTIEVVPALAAALKDRERHVRSRAADALGNIGLGAVEAVPALLGALKDPDIAVWSSATDALGNIGPAAVEAVPALVAALKEDPERPAKSRSYPVRSRAADALVKIGPDAVPALVATLKDPHYDIQSCAADALGKIGPDAVPALIAALGESESHTRSCAADALAKMGPAAIEAVPALLAALEDSDTLFVRPKAAKALGNIGPAAVAAVPLLVAALGVNSSAVEALGKIGRSAVRPLVAVLKEDRERQNARPGRPASSRVRGYLDRRSAAKNKAGLRIPDRAWAAEALGEIGPDAVEAAPALVAALEDPEVHVRFRAAEALGNIGPAAVEAVPALVTALKDQDTLLVAPSAAQALGKIGPDAIEAVPVLLATLEDPGIHSAIRFEAARALGNIGADAAVAGPALVSVLRDPNASVRLCAAEALGKIGPDAVEAVPPLVAALEDPDLDVRCNAARALGNIGPDAAMAGPALVNLLKEPVERVRSSAAEALGKIGPDAAEARPAREGPDEDERSNATLPLPNKRDSQL